MNEFYELFKRYIEGEQTEVSWDKLGPLPAEVVSIMCLFVNWEPL